MNNQTKKPQPPPHGHPADALWQKIEQFNLDDPNAAFPFSRKLAKENGWDEAFTLRAIEEYKRFVYLCCTAPESASPSPVVDEVWHLHLCYTVNYWDHFCDQTLRRKLHHHPSAGGAAEQQRHHEWNERTLANYRQAFHAEPPEDIWQPSGKAAPRAVFMAKLMLLPLRRQAAQALIPLLLLPLLAGCESPLPGVIPFLLLMITGSFLSSKNKKGSNEISSGNGGSSCGSSGGSCGGGCGSGCGGGCGGCGGGD